MFTFTFDHIYYFDRPEYQEEWYGYTHMMVNPFGHGHFRVADGTFVRGSCSAGMDLAPTQISEMEAVLQRHGPEMGLDQFEIYKARPAWYREAVAGGAEHASLLEKLRTNSSWHPRFGAAWDALTQAEPAYRLNRSFVNRVIETADRLSAEVVEEALQEQALDAWTYDVGPYAGEGETLETFLEEQRQSFLKPDPPGGGRYESRRIFRIEGVNRLYLIEHDPETAFYYLDLEGVLVRVFLPPHGGWKPHYIR